MRAIKTAISIENDLFQEAEEMAREMKVSRSKLFVMALQEFISRRKNKELLDQLNTAYEDEPDASEQILRRKSQTIHRKMVEGEW